jgi:prevent-host-death family protein
MSTVNIHEAKTQLSRLVDQAARGQEFIIAKAGKPMVRVVPYHPADGRRALGSLAGAYKIPKDIKAGFAADIAAMFDPKP